MKIEVKYIDNDMLLPNVDDNATLVSVDNNTSIINSKGLFSRKYAMLRCPVCGELESGCCDSSDYYNEM